MNDYYLNPRCAVLEGESVTREVLKKVNGTDAEFIAVRGEDPWDYGYSTLIRVVDAPIDHNNPRAGYVWDYVSRAEYLQELMFEINRSTAK